MVNFFSNIFNEGSISQKKSQTFAGAKLMKI